MIPSSLTGWARCAITLSVALLSSLPAAAAVITVDSGTDDGVGCTLREAIEAANTDTAIGGCAAGDDVADEIRFTVATVTLAAGELQIDEALLVVGPVTVTAAPIGRIVSIAATGVVEFRDVTLTGGRGEGGAIFATGATVLRLIGGAATANAAPTLGGAILLGSAASLFVDGTAFTGNQARGGGSTRGGGAIYTMGGAVTVQNATFTDNRALGVNGSGGAIHSANDATLTITNSTFTANRAQRAGGAIEAVGGVTTIEGGLFEGNTASASSMGNGGAVHVGLGADVTVRDAAAIGNRANEGGAFWVTGGSALTLLGVAVQDNIADGDAADQGGGGVYSEGTLVIASGASVAYFSDNRATGTSGAGGAVFVNNGAATLTGAIFQRNRAQRAGGAIELAIRPSGVPTLVVSITDCQILRNVVSGTPGIGGGLHTSNNVIALTIDATTFRANSARGEGGGLWITAPATLTMTRSYLSANGAHGTSDGGGGLYVRSGDVTVSSTTFTGNWTYAAGSLGAGVLAAGGTTRLSGTTLSYNGAVEGGGGLAVVEGATLTVENSTVYGNAARFGAGGYSANGTLSFDSATIVSNRATIGGGGLYNQNSPNQGTPVVTLANTIVAGNTAGNGATDPNLKGRYASGGSNMISTTPDAITFPAVASDQTGTDPQLGPLQNNGGATYTAALLLGSPAIDTGSTALMIDQRGVPRTEPDDIGAVEFGDADVALVITGVVDGPLAGGTPKVIELYVIADIADLSVYGVESANNGGGAAGPEFTFPAVAASAGDFLTIASEAPGFLAFFGFAPTYTSAAANINGDDAVLLYKGAVVMDAYGDADVDGTAQPWEYTDGWAYRNDATGPDGGTFVLEHFLRGPGELVGVTTNATAETPFPIGTYSPAGGAAASGKSASVEAMTEAVRLGVVPNPFGARARATFTVREAQRMTATLYDVMGRQVQQVYSGHAAASTPVTVSVDGGSLASGVYVLVLQGETVRATRQVTVAR